LLLALCLAVGLAASAWAGPAPEGLLEELNYRIDVLLWQDAVRVRLTLKRLEPGRYQAEISGEPQGVLKRLTGRRPPASLEPAMFQQRGSPHAR